VIGGQPDHGPHMLYFFVVHMFFLLRFWYATIICWLLIVSFLIGVIGWVNEHPSLWTSIAYMFVANLSLMFASYVTEFWIRTDFERESLLTDQQRRTREVLNDLLPTVISSQLVDTVGKKPLIAHELKNVSVMFSDIVGFTEYSANVSASEVVKLLNILFTTFDELTTVHHVLKVETIGDAYLVASGVFGGREDHAILLANMAIDMDFVLREFQLKDDRQLKMRRGLHSGGVIAGVVGVKVPRYHLFGNTVTIASLMEKTGSPDRVHVSEQFHDQVQQHDFDCFVFEPAAAVDLGNGTVIKTFFLDKVDKVS